MVGGTMKYRTFWRRFFAAIIDSLVLLPVMLAGLRLASIRNEGAIFAGAMVAGLASFAYSVLMHARFGQTVGKMVTGVKVLDLTETRIPTLKQAFLRDIGYIVLEAIALIQVADNLAEGARTGLGRNDYLDSAYNVWFLIEVVSMLTNSKRRALHDFIAWTVVVRSR